MTPWLITVQSAAATLGLIGAGLSLIGLLTGVYQTVRPRRLATLNLHDRSAPLAHRDLDKAA